MCFSAYNTHTDSRMALWGEFYVVIKSGFLDTVRITAACTVCSFAV